MPIVYKYGCLALNWSGREYYLKIFRKRMLRICYMCKRYGRYAASRNILKSVMIMWRIFTAPVDALMCFGDELIDWAVCPSKVARGGFWQPMEVAGRTWRGNLRGAAYLRGWVIRMIKHAGGLSLKLETYTFARITANATIGWISGASWRDRQFFRIPGSDRLHFLQGRMNEALRVAECELLSAARCYSSRVETRWTETPHNPARRQHEFVPSGWKIEGKPGIPNRTLRRSIEFC